MLTGTQKGFDETFGSTCHGAVSLKHHQTYIVFTYTFQGRALSRAKSRYVHTVRGVAPVLRYNACLIMQENHRI